MGGLWDQGKPPSKANCNVHQCYVQAGGVASTGMYMGKIGRILEVVPEHIHDKCPIIMGGARDVDQVLKLYQQAS